MIPSSRNHDVLSKQSSRAHRSEPVAATHLLHLTKTRQRCGLRLQG